MSCETTKLKSIVLKNLVFIELVLIVEHDVILT